MASSYQTVIKKAFQDGGLLDALLALQKRDGYITEEALKALAEHEGKSPTELYDTASFYSIHAALQCAGKEGNPRLPRYGLPQRRQRRVDRGAGIRHRAEDGPEQ